jgi:hypothetical protein
MTHPRRLISVLLLTGAAIAVSVVPAFGAGSGSVDMKVTVASPCLTVGPATPVDFGNQSFSTPSAQQTATSNAISFANCASVPENVTVRGTDATGPSAVWTLVDSPPSQFDPTVGGQVINECLNAPPPDKYSVRVEVAVGTETAVQGFNGHLSKLDTFLRTVSGVASFQGATTYPTVTKLLMPCTGSSGAGQAMSFQAVYTASF